MLVAETAAQLAAWKARIEVFLAARLLLQLNPTRERLRPVSDGVDFLGYIVRPTHLLVRRRVVGHLRETLRRHQGILVAAHPQATAYRFDGPTLNSLQASLASYLGHFRRAACGRLVASIWAEHPWLNTFMALDQRALRLRRHDAAPAVATSVLVQYRRWCEEFPGDVVLIQVGAFVERLQWPPRRLLSTPTGTAPPAGHAVAATSAGPRLTCHTSA